jgi:hypothetical protein
MKTTSVFWPGLAAAIAALGVAIHLAAIAGGPSWYAWFGAPPAIVASAREGTWLAPASAAAIAALMAVCAAYACSAIGLVRRLPWLRPVLAGIAAICLLRALLLVPLAIRYPALCTPFEIGAALVWGGAGIGFAVAVLHAGRLVRLHHGERRA